jgi:hypothetical protein
MNWSNAENPSRKTMHRVLVLLIALADLAERAACRSALVRWPVLWVLGAAEAVARDYIAGLTQDPALADAAFAALVEADGAGSAERLARRFRLLAAILADFFVALLATLDRGFLGGGGRAQPAGLLAAPSLPGVAARLDSS